MFPSSDTGRRLGATRVHLQKSPGDSGSEKSYQRGTWSSLYFVYKNKTGQHVAVTVA